MINPCRLAKLSKSSTNGETDPISLADNIRVVLIGNPEAAIRNGMKAGAISRPKLAEIIAPMSGNTYQKLRAYSDKFV